MRKPLRRLLLAFVAVIASYVAVSLDPPAATSQLSPGTLTAMVLLALAGVSLVLAVVGFLVEDEALFFDELPAAGYRSSTPGKS